MLNILPVSLVVVGGLFGLLYLYLLGDKKLFGSSDDEGGRAGVTSVNTCGYDAAAMSSRSLASTIFLIREGRMAGKEVLMRRDRRRVANFIAALLYGQYTYCMHM